MSDIDYMAMYKRAPRADLEQVIPKRYHEAALDQFADSEIDTDELAATLEAKGGIVLYGPPGTGKTHLTAALVRSLFEDEKIDRPAWLNTATMFDQMRRAINDPTVERIDPSGADLIVWEDLGRERPSPFVIEQFYVLVNRAYENMIPMIITTNLRPTDLAGFVGPQAYDRLCEVISMPPVNMNGPSRRGAM